MVLIPLNGPVQFDRQALPTLKHWPAIWLIGGSVSLVPLVFCVETGGMSPNQVRFVSLISLAAIVAVSANALLLNGREPSQPRGSQTKQAHIPQPSAQREPQIQRRGGFEPTSTSRDVGLPNIPQAEGDPAIIRALKRALSDRGYGPLTNEPTTGLATRAAILAFEFDFGLPLAGEATEALLAKMAGLIEPRTTGRTLPLRPTTPAAEAVVRHVQHKLQALGYLEGRVDGRLSDAMQLAIRRFEADQKLEPRGRISVVIVERLEAVATRL